MDLFEFLFVVVSIMIGLGIAELLGGVARILRGDLVVGRLHSLWILIVFQLQLQQAWGMWGLRDRDAWRYPEFVLVLLGPGILYMAAAVLFPASTSTESLDAHLMRRRRPFFALNIAYIVFTLVLGLTLFSFGMPLVATVIRVTVVAALVALAHTQNRVVQWSLGLLILAGQLWWTYLFTFVAEAVRT